MMGGYPIPPDKLSRQQTVDARRLNLFIGPADPAAFAVVNAVLAKVLAAEARTGKRQRKRRASAEVQLRDAIGAIVGNLLLAWGQEKPLPTSRSLDHHGFSGEPIGARAFTSAVRLMKSCDFLRQRQGGRSKDGRTGLASRFWPTHLLLILAADHGVDRISAPGDFQHVRPTRTKAPRVRDPIVMKAIRQSPGLSPGGRLRLDPHDPITAALRKEVEDLNAFAATVDLEGCIPPRWQRQFRENFRLYGRLHAVGDGNYQNMKPANRLGLIRIGGEPVVEIDIGSSHLSIMHGLLRLPLPEGDLYAVPGLPREVVKAWINATLGNGRPHQRWPKELLAKKPELAAHPIGAVKAAVTARYPWLSEPALAAEEFARFAPTHRVLPHLLMGVEAEVMMTTVQALRSKLIFSLPVYDGLIVPASARDVACRLLVEAGERIVGIRLRLDVKQT